MSRHEPKELSEAEIAARKKNKQLTKGFFKMLEKSRQESEQQESILAHHSGNKGLGEDQRGSYPATNSNARAIQEDEAAKIRERYRREEEQRRLENIEKLRRENELKRRRIEEIEQGIVHKKPPKASQSLTHRNGPAASKPSEYDPLSYHSKKPKEPQDEDRFRFSLVTSTQATPNTSRPSTQSKPAYTAYPKEQKDVREPSYRSVPAATQRAFAPENAARHTREPSNYQSTYNPLEQRVRHNPQRTDTTSQSRMPQAPTGEISAVFKPDRQMVHDLAMIKRKIDQKKREDALIFGPTQGETDVEPPGSKSEGKNRRDAAPAAKEARRKKADIENDPNFFYCFRCQETHHKNKHGIGIGPHLGQAPLPIARPIQTGPSQRAMQGIVPTSDPRAQQRQDLENKRKLELALGKRDPYPREEESRRRPGEMRGIPRRDDRGRVDPQRRERLAAVRRQESSSSEAEEYEEGEEEDDSDLDGFIDDEETGELDPKMKEKIYKTLRYNPEKYRRNDRAIDEREMEVRNYAVIEREEKYSRRIGRMEDEMEELRNNRSHQRGRQGRGE